MENPNLTPPRFQQALALHQAGRPAEAQALYQEIIIGHPGHFDSHHLLGASLIQTGQVEAGIASIRRALTIDSRHPEAHYNLGHGLSSLGKFDEAIPCFEAAIALNPRDPEYFLELANAQAELNNTDAALANYDRAIRLKPNYVDALGGRAKTLRTLGHHDEALAIYDRIIALRPRDPAGYAGRGQVLKDLAQYEAALADCDKAISLKPDLAEAHLRRGIALRELRRPDEALRSYDRAIELKPDYVEAFSSRGNILRELRRLDEALASFDKAIDLSPDYAQAHSNRALVLKDKKRFDEALAGYERAITLKPDYAPAYYNKSLLLLHRESLEEGFSLYDWRWKNEEFGNKLPRTNIPKWTGSPFPGKLLLWPEQGLGDEVFFASLLSLLPDGANETTLGADRRLDAIYARSFPKLEVIDRARVDEALTGDFDAQASIADLGHLLKVTRERLHQRTYPFLQVNRDRQAEILAANDFLRRKPVCGIAWRSANKKIGEEKSITIDDLAPLLKTPNVTFVNLQYGDVADEIESAAKTLGTRIHQAAELDVFNDIDGLLSLIDACEIILTTSNVTAHLAGSIGKKAAVLVPNGKGRLWYWHDQPQSIWYPSLNLFKQGNNWDWSEPALQATDWIREHL
jgi:tetratricopeptide (TPR) repeat protein